MLMRALLRSTKLVPRTARTLKSAVPTRCLSSVSLGGENLSSFGEPSPSLFPVQPLGSPKSEDKDAPLRSDIRTMGSILGKIIVEHEGEDVYEKIETMRQLARMNRG